MLRESPSVDSIQDCWQSIVEEYTKRSLTYADDIFPALQGLAKLVPPSMGTYLAGHWESALTRSLFWYTGPYYRTLTVGRPKEWRAPTWSWAAPTSPVSWLTDGNVERDTFVTILSTKTVPKGNDNTGQLSYGEIVLKGRCLSGIVANEKTYTKGHFLPRLRLEKLYFFNYSKHGKQHGAFPKPWWCHVIWDNDMKNEGYTPVVAMKVNTSDNVIVGQLWLVLKTIDRDRGVYERIGLMIICVREVHWHRLTARKIKELDALYESVAKEMIVTIV
ncbi:Nn.00g089380.m01.CDS01 [Neocucurbitaria sp. VM-36]